MHILFHKLFRDQHAAELRQMQPEILAILCERGKERDMLRMRIAMARDRRNRSEMV